MSAVVFHPVQAHGLACFPMCIEWEVATGWYPTAPPFPAPIVTSETAFVLPVPMVVESLERYALPLGWDARLTYSEGWAPHATHGRPLAKPQAKWVVRMRRGSERAVAVRTEGSWTSLWTWSVDHFFTRHGTLESFKGGIA